MAKRQAAAGIAIPTAPGSRAATTANAKTTAPTTAAAAAAAPPTTTTGARDYSPSAAIVARKPILRGIMTGAAFLGGHDKKHKVTVVGSGNWYKQSPSLRLALGFC